MPMPQNPYAAPPPRPAPAAPLPPQPGMGPTPQQFQELLAQGFQVGPDGSLVPPMMGGNGIPNAGAMRAAQNVPPPPFATGQPAPNGVAPPPQMPQWQPPQGVPGLPAAPPAPQADPMQQMMQGAPGFMGGQEAPPPPPVNLSVPGGASIMGGQPQAAKPPVPPAFKPTYNVTMATDPEAARSQHMTEVQRGQNHTAKFDREEMQRARKVQTMRNFFGTR
jgi:hypothetical protein